MNALISKAFTLLLLIPIILQGEEHLLNWDVSAWDRSRPAQHFHHEFHWYGAPYYYMNFPYYRFREVRCIDTRWGRLCLYRNKSGNKKHWMWLQSQSDVEL